MSKSVTIYDLAKAANVSTTTVHKALHGLGGISEEKRSEILGYAGSLGYRRNIIAQTLGRKEYKIGVILDAEDTDFLKKVKKGIFYAATRLKDYKVNVYFSKPNCEESHLDKDATLASLSEMLRNDTDAIILYPSISYREFQEFNPIIKEKGIPIVTINNAPSTLDYSSSVQYDDELLGKVAGELINLCGHNFESAAFVGTRDVTAQANILTQYENTLKKGGNDLVVSYENQYSDDINEILTKSMIEKHSYLNTIFIAVSQNQGIIKTLDENNLLNNFKIITVDVVPETLKLLTSGKIMATLDRHPFLIGELAVEMLYSHLSTGCDISGNISLPSTVVLPCHAENYRSAMDITADWAAYFTKN